jgi:hypothetical protein
MWTAAGASSYDVRLGSINPLPSGTTYFWQIVAHNGGGSSAGPLGTFTTAAAPTNQIVIYAGDIPPAFGVASTANALSNPAECVDVTLTADANRPSDLAANER